MAIRGRLHKYLLGIIDTTPEEFIKTASANEAVEEFKHTYNRSKSLKHLGFRKIGYVCKEVKE